MAGDICLFITDNFLDNEKELIDWMRKVLQDSNRRLSSAYGIKPHGNPALFPLKFDNMARSSGPLTSEWQALKKLYSEDNFKILFVTDEEDLGRIQNLLARKASATTIVISLDPISLEKREQLGALFGFTLWPSEQEIIHLFHNIEFAQKQSPLHTPQFLLWEGEDRETSRLLTALGWIIPLRWHQIQQPEELKDDLIPRASKTLLLINLEDPLLNPKRLSHRLMQLSQNKRPTAVGLKGGSEKTPLVEILKSPLRKNIQFIFSPLEFIGFFAEAHFRLERAKLLHQLYHEHYPWPASQRPPQAKAPASSNQSEQEHQFSFFHLDSYLRSIRKNPLSQNFEAYNELLAQLQDLELRQTPLRWHYLELE